MMLSPSSGPDVTDWISVWINIALVCVTVLATTFAGIQAYQAKKAREAADKANVGAAGHERAAVEAAERSAEAESRSANALERSNEILAAMLEGPPPMDRTTARFAALGTD